MAVTIHGAGGGGAGLTADYGAGPVPVSTIYAATEGGVALLDGGDGSAEIRITPESVSQARDQPYPVPSNFARARLSAEVSFARVTEAAGNLLVNLYTLEASHAYKVSVELIAVNAADGSQCAAFEFTAKIGVDDAGVATLGTITHGEGTEVDPELTGVAATLAVDGLALRVPLTGSATLDVRWRGRAIIIDLAAATNGIA